MKLNLRDVQLSKSRPTIPAVVNSLAESMRESGLINPIIVRKALVYTGIMSDGYMVVAGNHRVSAARQLGWDEIDAFVIGEGEELQAELIEIDENLIRAELSAAQRAASIKRRKEIWEALHPSSGTNCPETRVSSRGRAGEGRPVEFAADTASKTGENKRDVNRHVARAEALGPDIHAVIGTSLDKGVELDALKTIPAEDRKELIERAKAGEQVSAREFDKDRTRRLVSQCLAELNRVARDVPMEDVRRFVRNMDVSPEAAAVAAQFAAKVAKAA